jgi:hypothetical protein
MTYDRWYLLRVTCDEIDYKKLFFVKSPDARLVEDSRTQEQIEQAASEKGGELAYVSNFSGISWCYFEKIEKAARMLVRRDHDVPAREIEVDVLLRILFPRSAE